MTIARRDLFRLAGVAAGSAFLPSLAFGQPRQAQPPAAPAEPLRWIRTKVGSLECTIVGDGSAVVSPIQPTMAPTAVKADLDAALDWAFHPRDAAKLEFNCVVVKTGSDVVLVDTGTGAPSGNPLGRVRENLIASSIRPEDVTAIIITHCHSDHLGGCFLPDGSLAYPNARVLMQRAEHAFWSGSAPDLSKGGVSADAKASMIKEIAARLEKLKGRLELVDPSSKLFTSLQLMDTSGHTPGHCSIMLDGGATQMCILADVAHNHVVMFANPEWTIAFDTDPKAAAATRIALFDRLAADRTRVLAYHLPWPGLGHLRAGCGVGGKGYDWIMEPWGT